MFGTSAMIKVVAVLIMVVIFAVSGWWITGLRADLAVSQENSRKLVESIDRQQQAITKMQEEQVKIRQINNDLNTTIKLQNKDVENLRDRFSQNAKGEARDLGKTAVAKPQSLERAVNKGTVNALRCLEIASGAPLTDLEKNATKPNEINRECPALANPNYKPTAGQ
jgi:uncharacterized membrane protein YccC